MINKRDRKKINKPKLGLNLWDRANELIPGGNMLLSKNKNIFSPGLWPCYYKKAKGSKVWDLDNNLYRDFSSNGVGACSLGHSNNYVDNKVIDTIKKGNMSTLNYPGEVFLAEMLVKLHPWADMARFARTGGEANAIAIRIARSYTNKDKVAICGYHGWHDWYLASTLNKKDSLDNHLFPGIKSKGIPKNLIGTVLPIRYNNFDDLNILKESTEIGTLKMEVLRSTKPKSGYLEEIEKICKSKNILLIFDECTSGFRETYGGIHLKYKINPDMCIFGKALGNGYAISAIIGRKDVMNEVKSTFISSTFWTEAIGSAAALASLEEMSRISSWMKLPVIGKKIKKLWKDKSQKHKLPIEISGIDALPTFKFINEYSNTYKTAFTEMMLTRSFLASTLFYPTCSHKDKDIVKYEYALDEVFSVLSSYYKINKDPTELVTAENCKNTFSRLN